MKIRNSIKTLFISVLLLTTVLFVGCNSKKVADEPKITLTCSDVIEVEENGYKYLDRTVTATVPGIEDSEHGWFNFSVKWTSESDKELSNYLELINVDKFSVTLRVKRKFENSITLEVKSEFLDYYGAFRIVYEGCPSEIKDLPTEVTMTAGVTQQFKLEAYNEMNPDASEEYNDFSVSIEYFGTIKTGEYLIVTATEQTFVEGSEKTYSDLTKLPAKDEYLIQAKIDGNVLILTQKQNISEYGVLHVYEDDNGNSSYATYENLIESSTLYAEVTITEQTSGYVQKIKVWMDV